MVSKIPPYLSDDVLQKFDCAVERYTAEEKARGYEMLDAEIAGDAIERCVPRSRRSAPFTLQRSTLNS